MAQDDEYSSYERGDDDLMLPDLPEPERPKAECKMSLLKRSLQEMAPDAACRCQNRRISGRGSRTVPLGRMVTGGKEHDVLPRFGPS